MSANVCFFPHKPESDDSIMYTDGLAELFSRTSASSLANDSGNRKTNDAKAKKFVSSSFFKRSVVSPFMKCWNCNNAHDISSHVRIKQILYIHRFRQAITVIKAGDARAREREKHTCTWMKESEGSLIIKEGQTKCESYQTWCTPTTFCCPVSKYNKTCWLLVRKKLVGP